MAVAQAARTLAELSGGRFLLGLGASGPQVIEGLHGVAFARPRTRLRETVEVVRMALAGEKVVYSGETVTIPLPGGEGQADAAVRHAVPGRPDLPGHALTADAAAHRGDRRRLVGHELRPRSRGRLPRPPRRGARRAPGARRADLDVCQGAEVAFAADEDELARMVDDRRAGLAFSLGGMGSATTNFYNAAYSRQGWAEVAARVRERWLAGDRVGAAALVTDEMVLATTLIGTEADGARPPRRVAGRGRGHRAPLPGGRDARRAGGDPGPGDRAGARDGRRGCSGVTLLTFSGRRSPRCNAERPSSSARAIGTPGRYARCRWLGASSTVRSARAPGVIDADVVAPQRLRAPPAVADHSASSGVMPISRTASAIISGIDDE